MLRFFAKDKSFSIYMDIYIYVYIYIYIHTHQSGPLYLFFIFIKIFFDKCHFNLLIYIYNYFSKKMSNENNEKCLVGVEDMLTWLDAINLSRPNRKLSRDFSDAVLMAEVIKVGLWTNFN